LVYKGLLTLADQKPEVYTNTFYKTIFVTRLQGTWLSQFIDIEFGDNSFMNALIILHSIIIIIIIIILTN